MQQAATLKPPFAPRPLPDTTATISQCSQHGAVTGAQQSTLDPTPRSPLDSLPTIAGRGDECFLVQDDIGAFLKEDLDLSRLNSIHTHLWMAGRPMRARPLHRYKMVYGYQVTGTQQMDLHLLRFSSKLLVKPLPEYMLATSFWEQHLCADEALWESAAGWLLSYIWLIASPLDLTIAHDTSLLPGAITWPWWKAFATDFLQHIDVNALDRVNKRYHFGHLRLSRINTIYRSRFLLTHFVRGYLYGYNRYVVLFERNVSWLLVVFIFLNLVLSAMQVGVSLDAIRANPAFTHASLVVVMLAIITVPFVLGCLAVLFSGIFLFNMIVAVRHARRVERARRDVKNGRAHKLV